MYRQIAKIDPSLKLQAYLNRPGCIEGDCINGYGAFNYLDGAKYIGKWKDGNYYGRGTYASADGRITKGIWKNNKLLSKNDEKITVEEIENIFFKHNKKYPHHVDRLDVEAQ